jgi:hypothetical protein
MVYIHRLRMKLLEDYLLRLTSWLMRETGE